MPAIWKLFSIAVRQFPLNEAATKVISLPAVFPKKIR
jgi:hypothetical protein